MADCKDPVFVETHLYTGHGGVVLAADVGGEAGRPPVILMHGGGQTRHSWGKAARDLVRLDFRVVSLDLRGHGESSWAPSGDYSLNAFVADLRCVVTTFRRPVALVGASLGGIISMIAIGEQLDLAVSALILVDVVPRPEKKGVERIQKFMAASPQGFATVEEAAQAIADYMPNRPRRPTSEGLMRNLRSKADGRLYWHWDPRFLASFKEQQESVFRRMEIAARSITVPTLIVRGKMSDVVSPQGVQLLRRSITQAQLVEIDDAGHMVAGDKNDRFNDAVQSFLESIERRPLA